MMPLPVLAACIWVGVAVTVQILAVRPFETIEVVAVAAFVVLIEIYLKVRR